MGLFNRVSNPLWSEVQRLPVDRRTPVATVIVGYDFCRVKVEEELVTPLSIVLAGGVSGQRRNLGGNLEQRLVDEALLGTLRSSAIPRDGRGVIPDALARSLPEVLGTLACAAANHHAGRLRGHVLEDIGYSDDPGVARRQVLAAWGELAGLSPAVLHGIDSSGFADKWHAVTTSLLEGMLTGLSRAGTATLLAQAEKVARVQPPYLRGIVLGLVGSAART